MEAVLPVPNCRERREPGPRRQFSREIGCRGDLIDRAKSGRYKAPPVKRAYVPRNAKEDRPIGLKINEEKTRLVRFGRPPRGGGAGGGGKPETFDFLGFTHYWAKAPFHRP